MNFFPIDDEIDPKRRFDPDVWALWGPDWDDLMFAPDYEPLPDDIAPPHLDELSTLLNRPATFRCHSHGPSDRSIDVAVDHILEPGIDSEEIPNSWPPSLRRILQWHNGMTLFLDSLGGQFENGFRFYSVAEAVAELGHLQQALQSGREQSIELEDHPKSQAWLDGLMPIGASLMSADYVVIDTLRRRSDGECPVIMLDHEAYFVGCGLPSSHVELATNVISFLAWLVKDPIDLMVGHWRHCTADHQQWYPVAVSFDEPDE